jgi:hypothetical protein|tara:strand:- start:53 stop:274 length:222 start_codon:yes stop_codon:yes gene_type:complete
MNNKYKELIKNQKSLNFLEGLPIFDEQNNITDKGQYLINSIFNTKYLIRDVFELDVLLDIKQLLDEQIETLKL